MVKLLGGSLPFGELYGYRDQTHNPDVTSRKGTLSQKGHIGQ